jgi:hypothetical protein
MTTIPISWDQYTDVFGIQGTGVAGADVFVEGLTVPSPTPEPASFLLFGTGIASIVVKAKRRSAKQETTVEASQRTKMKCGWSLDMFAPARPNRGFPQNSRRFICSAKCSGGKRGGLPGSPKKQLCRMRFGQLAGLAVERRCARRMRAARRYFASER